MRGKTFHYLYDFGDGWEHSVKIQGIAPADPQGSYPRLLEATGMRPPEDSGGPWGYAEKLEALTDPAHEYHEEALEALGDDHDSHAQPNIAVRSEEHTSELQSLMRISYAVFCLKKKTQTEKTRRTTEHTTTT